MRWNADGMLVECGGMVVECWLNAGGMLAGMLVECSFTYATQRPPPQVIAKLPVQPWLNERACIVTDSA